MLPGLHEVSRPDGQLELLGMGNVKISARQKRQLGYWCGATCVLGLWFVFQGFHMFSLPHVDPNRIHYIDPLAPKRGWDADSLAFFVSLGLADFAGAGMVFSVWIFSLVLGAALAADAVDEALTAGDTSAARFEAYGEAFRKQMEPMRKLVYAFYDDGFSFGKFLKEHPDLRPQVTDVLIGVLEKDYDDFFSVMGDFADLPEPLPHGAPIGADHTHSEQG